MASCNIAPASCGVTSFCSVSIGICQVQRSKRAWIVCKMRSEAKMADLAKFNTFGASSRISVGSLTYLLEPMTMMVQKRRGEAAKQSFGRTSLSNRGRKRKFLSKNLEVRVRNRVPQCVGAGLTTESSRQCHSHRLLNLQWSEVALPKLERAW